MRRVLVLALQLRNDAITSSNRIEDAISKVLYENLAKELSDQTIQLELVTIKEPDRVDNTLDNILINSKRMYERH